ncbi:MAG: hypothetical protein Q3962_09060 [Corynebacterium sp.]|nr:hypothetical protein [Corynebacterium sp.]
MKYYADSRAKLQESLADALECTRAMATFLPAQAPAHEPYEHRLARRAHDCLEALATRLSDASFTPSPSSTIPTEDKTLPALLLYWEDLWPAFVEALLQWHDDFPHEDTVHATFEDLITTARKYHLANAPLREHSE